MKVLMVALGALIANSLNVQKEEEHEWTVNCAHVTAHVHTGVVMLSEIIPNTFVAKILTNYEIREGASVGSFGIVDPLSSKFF